MFLSTINAYAQSNVCKGTVTDSMGESVIGASVMVKGTTNGTITDIDGNFMLNGCKTGDTLQISYIGYVTYEHCVENFADINVQLCEDFGDIGIGCYGNPCSSSAEKLPCTACETAATEWEATGTAGYESRLAGGTCSGNTSTSHGICTGQITQYRCADGYTGTTTDGKTGCIRNATCTSGCCGTVIAESDSLPLIGASVVLMKPTTPSNSIAAGVISDMDGMYQISCEVGDKLVFLFLGMARQEIIVTANNKSGLIISMTDDTGIGICDSGYYMDWSTGQSTCNPCPADGETAGVIPSSNNGQHNNTIYYCRIPSSTPVNDESGIYMYTSDCYYDN